MTELSSVSFELNEEMLILIANEFDIRQLVSRFFQTISGKDLEEIEAVAKDIFSRYGCDWIRRSVQLGEQYTDRTYEVLQEAIDSTGGHLRFPLLPQRFLEIAYLSTHGMELLPVYENSSRRLVYRVDDCKMFQTIREECGKEVAGIIPCKYACLSACKTLFDDLDYPKVHIEMAASTNQEGYCRFVITRT